MTNKMEQTAAFLPVNIAIVTVSDTRTHNNDHSGDRLEELVKAEGHKLIERHIVKDDLESIKNILANCIKNREISCVITTGGTGITKRDVTPEAFEHILEKKIDGFGEMFRWISYQKIGTSALQSRAVGGITGNTCLFALPGSPGAVQDGWEHILKYQLDSRHTPCNLAKLLPRLT